LLLNECSERLIDLSFGARIHIHELKIKSTGNALSVGSL
jgi:hypothetical protein